MKATRTLRLSSEVLGELGTSELAQVVGGTHLGCAAVTDACTHGACGTDSLAPIHSCLLPCPTRDPQFSCGLC